MLFFLFDQEVWMINYNQGYIEKFFPEEGKWKSKTYLLFWACAYLWRNLLPPENSGFFYEID